MRVAIIDYGSGNLRSAAKAFERSAVEGGTGATVEVTSDPDRVTAADRIVLPGVGAFADCRRGLAAVDGMEAALTEAVQDRGLPFLGICVGMQLMADRGFEHGTCDGLGWLPGEVVPLEPSDPSLKVPHMGWNELAVRRAHPLLDGLDAHHAYFVHSFHFRPANAADLIAEAEHGGPVTAVIARDNLVGTQFHPEKSQRLGLHLIRNFLAWTP